MRYLIVVLEILFPFGLIIRKYLEAVPFRHLMMNLVLSKFLMVDTAHEFHTKYFLQSLNALVIFFKSTHGALSGTRA